MFDTTKPTVTAVSLSLSDGLVTISFSESINVDGLLRSTYYNQGLGNPWTGDKSQAMNLGNFFLSDRTNGFFDGTIGLGSSNLLSTTDGNSVQFQLSDNQRYTAIEKSGQPGGDGVALTFDVTSVSFFDQATNPNGAQLNFAITETPDIVKLTLDYARVYYSTGVIHLEASERMNLDDPSTMVHLDRLFLSDVAGDERISMVGATVTAVDGQRVTITMTESQRVQAIAMSNTPGGDGTSIVIDARDGAFQDIGLTTSQSTDGSATWTFTIASQTFGAADRAVVTQGTGGGQSTGLLVGAISGGGATITIVVSARIGQSFDHTSANLVVGGTIISVGNLVSVAYVETAPSHPAAWTTTVSPASTATATIGAVVTQPTVSWTIQVALRALTEVSGVGVSQNGQTGKLRHGVTNSWTLTINAATFSTINAGVSVTQTGGVTGTLKYQLSGAGITTIVVETASGVTFTTTENLNIGSGAATVLAANVNAAINTGATKTLVVTSLVGQSFDTADDLVVGSITIPSSEIVSIKYAQTRGTLRVALDGTSTTEVHLSSSAGVHFDPGHNLIVEAFGAHGATTFLASAVSDVVVALYGLPGLNVTEVLDTTLPVIQSAAVQYGPGTMQLTMSETVDLSPSTHIDLSKLFLNGEPLTWTFALSSQLIANVAQGATVTQPGNSATGLLKTALTGDGVTQVIITANVGQAFDALENLQIGGTPVIVLASVLSTATAVRDQISLLGGAGEPDTTVVSGTSLPVTLISVDGNILYLQLPELIRVEALVRSSRTGGDTVATVVDANAGLLFDIGLNENIQTLGVIVTEIADLIPPTLISQQIFYDNTQLSTLVLGFSETIDVDPANLIDKTKLKIVDYQGQTTGSVAMVDATQSTVQSTFVTFTLTEAQRVAAIRLSGTPGGNGYMVWSFDVTSQTIASQSTGVVVSQANGVMTWTFTITSQSIASTSAGVTVTQTSQSGAGTLTTTVAGATTEIVVTSPIGQVFDAAAPLVLDVGGSPVTIPSAGILDVEYLSTPNAVGTLTSGVSGAGIVSISVTTASVGINFDVNVNLVVGTAIVAHSTISDATSVVFGTGLLDLTAGAFRDMGENILNPSQLGVVLVESPDTTRPVFTVATLDLNDGRLYLDASETLDVSSASELDLSAVHVVDATANVDTTRNDAFYHTRTYDAVSLIGSTVTAEEKTQITIKLTEDQRNMAIALSNTPGGDSTQLRVDFDARTVHDVAQLDNLQQNNVALVEIADTTRPTITAVTIDFNDGKVVITGSEVLDVSPTSLLVLDRLWLENSTNATDQDTDCFDLVGSTIVQQEAQTITLVLTESTRVKSLALSGVTGGDDVGLQFRADSHSVRDLAGNMNAYYHSITATEIPDTVLPTVVSSTLDYSNGKLIITASETLDTTPTTKVDTTKLRLVDAVSVWTLTINSANIVETKGVAVTMGTFATGILKENLSGADTTTVIVTSKSSTVWTIQLTSPISINQPYWTTVSQGGVDVGYLRTDNEYHDSSGAVSTVIVEAYWTTPDLTKTTDIVIGGTTIAFGNIASVSDTAFVATPPSPITLVIGTSDPIAGSDVTAVSMASQLVTGSTEVSLSGCTVVAADGVDITLQLLEAQRAAAIAISGVHGGDGGAVYFDVLSGGINDIAQNDMLNDLMNSVTETRDTVAPTVISTTIDYSTGVLTITASETLDATPSTNVDPSKIQISETAGDPEGLGTGVKLTGATVTQVDGVTVTVTLTELQRSLVIAMSNTPGGDGVDAVVIDFEAGALLDVGVNYNQGAPHNQGIACVETADTVLPSVTRARLDYSTGVVEIDTDEIVDVTPGSYVDLNQLFLADASGDDYVGLATLGGGVVSGADGQTFTVTLTESQRAKAVVESGVLGGDGGSLVLDAKAAAVRDIAQNDNAGELNLILTETPDIVRPTITAGAFLSLGTGVLAITTSETVLHRTFDADGVNIINHNSAFRLALTASQTYVQSVGALVTQAAAVTTHRILLSPAVTIIKAKGVPVTQSAQAGTLKNSMGAKWTILLTSGRAISEIRGVAVTQSNGYMTWTLTTNTIVVSESQGVEVSQTRLVYPNNRVSSGTLHTQLGPGGTTTVVITAIEGTTFDTDSDLVVGTTEIAKTDILTATFDTLGGASGLTEVALSGTSTTFDVLAAPGVVFDSTTTMLVGGTEILGAQIQSATLSGDTTYLEITAADGQTFNTNDDIVVGGAGGDVTIPSSKIQRVESYVEVSRGVLKTELGPSATSTIEVSVTSGTFHTTKDLIVGSLNVPHSLLDTSTFVPYITEIPLSGASVTTQYNEWTLTISTQDLTFLPGVTTVTQGASLGTLSNELTGVGTTTIIVVAASGVTFLTTADLILVDAGAPSTVNADNVQLSSSAAAPRVTSTFITMTESQRVRAIELSGTPGGDTVEAALLIHPYRFADLSHNYNDLEVTLKMFELPDDILPTVVSGRLDLESGVLTITASETIDVTPASLVDVTKFELHQVSNRDEWRMSITSQSISESANAAVVQGGSAVGTLVTACTNVWSIGIQSQSLSYVPGDTVTQGSSTGTLVLELNGASQTSIQVSAASGITFVPGVAVGITNGGVSSTVVAARVLTAATSTGTIELVISGVSGVTFDASTDMTVGTTAVSGSNIQSIDSSNTMSFSRDLIGWSSNNQPDHKTFKMILTEAQRAVAVAMSSTSGGDGTPIVLDVEAAGYQDIAQNQNLQQHGIVLSEDEDDSEPTIVSAAIFLDDQNARMEITSNETLDVTPASQVSLSSLILKNRTTTVENELHLQLTASGVILLDGTTVTITLTEAQRVQALYHSNTPGGDGNPLVFQSLNAAFKDVAQNLALVSSNLTVTETEDSTPPTITAVAIDLGTGILTFDASETLDFTPQLQYGMWDENNLIEPNGTNIHRMFISDHSHGATINAFNISLAAATVMTTNDALQFFVRLTEESRASAIRISGENGGSFPRTAAFINVLDGVIMDIGQNKNTQNQSLLLTESADLITPFALRAELNYGTGSGFLYCSETIRALDLTKVRIVNQVGDANYPMNLGTVQTVDSTVVEFKLHEDDRLLTLAISGTPGGDGHMEWTVTFSQRTLAGAPQGGTVTQNNGYTTWTVAIKSQTITASAGVSVTQASQSGVGVLRDATGANTILLKVKTAIGQTFDRNADIVLNGDPAKTIPAADITSVFSTVTPHATGTLKAPGTSSDTSIVIVTAGVGITFDTVTDISVFAGPPSYTISANTISLSTSVSFGSVVIDMDAGALQDVALNYNLAQSGIVVTETPDTIPPIVISSKLNYSTGVLEFTCSETVDVTPSSLVDLDLLFLSDLTGDHAVQMTGATIESTADSPTLTLTLTEAQRTAAIRISGVPGGDTDAVVLDAEIGSLTDITGASFCRLLCFCFAECFLR